MPIRIILSLALTLFSTPNAHARTWDQIKKSGELRAAVDGATPGFNFFEGKKLTGFEVDITAEMAKRLGLKITWVVQPFNTLLISLGEDRFDLIATSLTITPERQKVVDFMEPLYCSGATIFSRKGGPKTEADLSGKIVSVPVGTVYFERLKKNTKIKQLKTLPKETDGLQDLLLSRSDAWVTEGFVGTAALKTHPELQMGESIFRQTNALVVSKGNDELRKVLNEQLALIRKDKTFAKLGQKYFGMDITCKH